MLVAVNEYLIKAINVAPLLVPRRIPSRTVCRTSVRVYHTRTRRAECKAQQTAGAGLAAPGKDLWHPTRRAGFSLARAYNMDIIRVDSPPLPPPTSSSV